MSLIRTIAALGIAALAGSSGYEVNAGRIDIHLLGTPGEAKSKRATVSGEVAPAPRPKRSSVSYQTLPQGCVNGNYNGGSYYNCSEVFFQQHHGSYWLVTF